MAGKTLALAAFLEYKVHPRKFGPRSSAAPKR